MSTERNLLLQRLARAETELTQARERLREHDLLTVRRIIFTAKELLLKVSPAEQASLDFLAALGEKDPGFVLQLFREILQAKRRAEVTQP